MQVVSVFQYPLPRWVSVLGYLMSDNLATVATHDAIARNVFTALGFIDLVVSDHCISPKAKATDLAPPKLPHICSVLATLPHFSVSASPCHLSAVLLK